MAYRVQGLYRDGVPGTNFLLASASPSKQTPPFLTLMRQGAYRVQGLYSDEVPCTNFLVACASPSKQTPPFFNFNAENSFL